MTTAQTARPPAADPVTDEDVVRRVVAGDTAMFEILVRRHNQRIYRTARAVLGSEDEVEDVMQQAYLNAYRSLHQFAGQARFATWLTRITVNEALARRRRSGRGLGTGDDAMAMHLVDTRTPDPERQAASAELRQAMEDEVAALPESLRVVFVMREVEGLSTAETSSCLGVSEEVVKTRLHRARAALRDNLYRRAGVTLDSIFTFGEARCDRVVAAVMARIAG